MNRTVKEDFFKKHTSFERARIIAARALQLELNAPFIIDFDKETLEKVNYDPVRLARIEYEKGVIPLEVRRLKDWTKGKISKKK
ncbi:MAG: DNA-directed RNA polymerase subunit K [Candidatus Woesearchaeota archaeon]